MQMRNSILLCALVLMAGCSGASAVVVLKLVAGPEFDVKVVLSDLARAELQRRDESIKVHVVFDGDSKSFIENMTSHNAPERPIYLGSQDIEVELSEVARVHGVKFDGEKYSRLSNGNYYVTINVVSGRRQLKYNLLNCEVPEGLMDNFKNQTIVVRCKLIDEASLLRAPNKALERSRVG